MSFLTNSSIISQPPSSNYLPHQYSHQQPYLLRLRSSNINMSDIRNALLYGDESRPPMLLPGTFTEWKQRFQQWLINRPDADLMLKSIRDGSFKMKFLADLTGIVRLQTADDLNDVQLAQYTADKQAAFTITLALPNWIYMNMKYPASAHDMWNYLESLHHKEELHHIRMK